MLLLNTMYFLQKNGVELTQDDAKWLQQLEQGGHLCFGRLLGVKKTPKQLAEWRVRSNTTITTVHQEQIIDMLWKARRLS